MVLTHYLVNRKTLEKENRMKRTQTFTKIGFTFIALIGVGAVVGFQPDDEIMKASLLDDPSLPDGVEELSDWVASDPNDVDARQKLALKYHQSGQREKAVAELHRAGQSISVEWDREVARLESLEAPNR